MPDALDCVTGDAPDELVETLRLVPDVVDTTQLESTGYIVHTLQTALYDALTASSAKEAIVTTVNRGGDTDTVGAVTGALAGARFGAAALPEEWLDTLMYRDTLAALAGQLVTLNLD